MPHNNTESKAAPQTDWQVITGAPCSGKSSVIHELERRGYRVVHEVARSIIDAELKLGRRLDQIKADPLAFERKILFKKIEIESRLPCKEIVFLDRAVPDSIAYFRVEGLDPSEPLSKSLSMRYRNVFILDRLGFAKDPVRCEDDGLALHIDVLLEEGYRRLGYEIIRVPVLSVKARVDYILQCIY
jgi:predicted ATPase